MYSGRFIRINKAAQNTGISKSELIEMGFDRDLSIFAWNQSWVREPMPRLLHNGDMIELPRGRHSIDTPLLLDDQKHLASLTDGESIIFGGNADVPIVCYKGSTDDDYLDGVTVTQDDLYCLKSEIEELERKGSQANPKAGAVDTCDADLEQTKLEKHQGSAQEIVGTNDQYNDSMHEAFKPWEISDPNDPAPEQPWYTPARYFARELVKTDSTLLTKRMLLAVKVVQSLDAVGIKKRGGKKSLNHSTILKAFSNIEF
jgi:hypothetical protein